MPAYIGAHVTVLATSSIVHLFIYTYVFVGVHIVYLFMYIYLLSRGEGVLTVIDSIGHGSLACTPCMCVDMSQVWHEAAVGLADINKRGVAN